MGLNIKNLEVEQLAGEVARLAHEAHLGALHRTRPLPEQADSLLLEFQEQDRQELQEPESQAALPFSQPSTVTRSNGRLARYSLLQPCQA